MDDQDSDELKKDDWLPIAAAIEGIVQRLSQDGAVDPAVLKEIIAAATKVGHAPFQRPLRIKTTAIRYAVEPRDIPPEKAARRLHLTMEGFVAHTDSLRARGFPQPDPTTGMYDLKAIDAWMDKRSGLAGLTVNDGPRNAGEVSRDRLERLRHG